MGIVAGNMERYTISLAHETWWLDQGRFTPEKREHGAGFILDKKTASSSIGFNPTSKPNGNGFTHFGRKTF